MLLPFRPSAGPRSDHVVAREAEEIRLGLGHRVGRHERPRRLAEAGEVTIGVAPLLEGQADQAGTGPAGEQGGVGAAGGVGLDDEHALVHEPLVLHHPADLAGDHQAAGLAQRELPVGGQVDRAAVLRQDGAQGFQDDAL